MEQTEKVTSTGDYKYCIRLSIRHPSLEASTITKALGLEPNRSWTVGEPRATPRGTSLAGTYGETYWNYDFKQFGQDNPSIGFEKMIQIIHENAKFFKFISKTYGSSEIDLQFYGGIHSGHLIQWQTLELLAKSNVNLGVEVFPNWVE